MAWYESGGNYTGWGMSCGNNWYSGRMGGDQTNALCNGSAN